MSTIVEKKDVPTIEEETKIPFNNFWFIRCFDIRVEVE